MSKNFTAKTRVSMRAALEERKPQRLNEQVLSRFGIRQVEIVSTRDLRPSSRNARTHSKAQIQQIAQSIAAFGFTNPIIADASNRIVAGHGRHSAALALGLKRVPVIRLEGLSPLELRAYALADNRLAEKAGWDDELLALELQELSALDLDFSIETTGFEIPEIDQLIAKLDERGGQKEIDQAAEICPSINHTLPTVSAGGDIWILSEHRLAVGDVRDAALIERLMVGSKAAAVVTDPPYNVRIPGFASGKGKAKHKDFAMASGEMTPPEYADFLQRCLGIMAANVMHGSYLAVFIDWRHIAPLVVVAESLDLQLRNICVWVKAQGGMGSLYRSQHELLALFSTGTPARNNIQLGRFGRNRTNVWHYPGPNSLRPEGRAELAAHPTVKPVAMIADAILDLTARGDIVLDPFAGSGTIFVAAEKTGRRAYGVEIDTGYADVCIKRWQQYTGREARLSETGETYEQVMRRRTGRSETPSGRSTAPSQPRTGKRGRK